MGCGMSNKRDKDSDSNEDKNRNDKKGGKDLDTNFRPINILVYKNGDEYDPGTIVAVTRRQFRNWVSLLEFLTRRLRLIEGAVHTLFTLEGEEVRHFKDIEDGTKYVACHNRIKEANYGLRPNPKWNAGQYYREADPGAIESRESLTKYLEQREFRPTLEDMWEDSGFDLRRGGGGRREEKRKETKKDDWDGVDHDKDRREKEKEKENERKRQQDKRQQDRSSRNNSRRSSSHSDQNRNRNRKESRRNGKSTSR